MHLLLRILISIIIISPLPIHGQDLNPHSRHMERAHPTPSTTTNYNHLPTMVPMIGENVFPSMFLNANMVVTESDQLPAQNESSIAVNPRNPRNLIGSAVDYRGSSSTWAYYSIDGGFTWNNVTLGTARVGWTSSNDPSVCFDHEGRGYLCYGGFRREGNVQFGENGIFVSSTTDGGATWGTRHVAVIIHTGQQTADSAFEDKYYIHADTAETSPNRGHLYIPWKRVINRDSSTQIVISKSTDKGATWSAPTAVSDRFPGTSEATTFGQSFPLARTGPDGSVHLVWNSGTESALRYARSTDGGTTWSAPRIIQQYRPFGVKSTINGQSNSRVKGVVRAECYPVLSIDNTRGTRNGWLYLTWAADNPYPNVYFSRSTDNGTTWSAPVIVHSDTTNDQFWSWVAVDPTNGELAVMYSDSRDDADNILVNTYVSWSPDGGFTWTDRRVGDAINDLRRNPFQGNTFAGDYSGCDFYNGIVYPSWVDMRNTYENTADNDVFTAVVHTRAPQAPERFTARTVTDRPTEIDLSWSRVRSLSFGQPLPNDTRIILFRNDQPIDTVRVEDTTFTDRGLVTYNLYKYKLVAVASNIRSAERNAEAYAGGSRELEAPVLISAVGEPDSSINVISNLPTLRKDGVTPIINLDSIVTEMSEQQFFTDVFPSDTGKRYTHTARVTERGWYRVQTRVQDTDGNRSDPSDTSWVFSGDRDIYDPVTREPRVEQFTNNPRYHAVWGSWGLTSGFSRSAPSSFAHSPNGQYGPSRRDTVILAPVETDISVGGGTGLLLNCYVAAFIDPTDTMFLEVASGSLNGPWERLEWWNASRDSRWLDTTKSEDAWRAQAIPLTVGAQPMYLRLRFRSNAARQSDGFYIDDLSYSITTSVDDIQSVVTDVAPQPANTTTVFTLASDAPVTSLSIVDIHGASHNARWTQHGRTLVLSVNTLPSGMYAVRMHSGAYSGLSRIMVAR